MKLSDAEKMLAVNINNLELSKNKLKEAEDRIEYLLNEKIFLTQEKSELQGRLAEFAKYVEKKPGKSVQN